jgi:ABC-2 type transport system ATP-binding protein
VIEVGFAAHDVAQRAAGELGSLGSVTVDGPHLRLSVADGAEAMLAAVRTLDGEHLQPVTMALREPTLDDVFLSLTGHGAEDGGDGDGDDEAGDGARARRSRRRSQ